MANHSAAFLRTVFQASNHLLSHHDVSILNHPYIHIHRATVARIHKIQFIALLIVSNNPEFTLSSCVRITFISSTWHLAQNLLQSHVSAITVLIGIADTHKTSNHKDARIQFQIYLIIPFFIL